MSPSPDGDPGRDDIVSSDPRRPGRITAGLGCVLAGTAGMLAVVAPHRAVFPVGVPGVVLVVLLAGGFFLGEQLLLSIEFRREAHATTLAGLALVIGVLVLPLPALLLARSVGAGSALLIQRVSPQKTFYNIAAWMFEAAANVTVVHALIGTGQHFGMREFGYVLVVVVAVDQVVSALVFVVIRVHGGPVTKSDVREAMIPGFLLAMVSTAISVGLLQLMQLGPLGAITVLVVALVMVILYRGYVLATRRHQRLELVHDFVSDGTDPDSFTSVMAALLARIRRLTRADTVTLTIFGDESVDLVGTDSTGNTVSHYVDGPDGFDLTRDRAAPDWMTMRALEGEPLLAPRKTKDHAVRTWLRQRGYRDAIVIPLPAQGGLVGTLTVADRLGETSTFETDDVTLLQTLVGHLVVAGRSARLVERLAYDATHDSLTGLVNRAELVRRIEAALTAGRPSACLLLDLDRFKEVNDGLGHAAGDTLLQVVAERIVAQLPPDSVIARLGGDEFAVLVPMPDDEPSLLTACAQLSEAIARPVVVDTAMLTPDASIGVVPASTGIDAGELLRRADVAMYAAKAHGHGIAAYHSDLDRDRAEDLALLADLRLALRESPEQIVVYYQPKLALDTRAAIGAEALIRWNHPTLGVVPPDRFVPLAERAGLVDQFVPIVLDRALAECRRWNSGGFALTVAVNLSAKDVGDPGLPDRVASALARARVLPSQLVLEITESSIIADPQQTLDVLDRLARMGVAISLDDFGTGYSSLSYLQRLPVSEVKIDRSFVAGLDSEDRHSSRTLIASIADLGSSLGLCVVAEGAESARVLDELGGLGCHVAQGFHVSRPVPAQEFAQWLKHWRPSVGTPELTLVDGTAKAAG